MTQVSLYDFIGVAVSATPQEIDAAIIRKYNDFRRLVTHHDQTVANQATMALQTLEQARGTLMDPSKRASYDHSIGVGQVAGGLTDPNAILDRLTGAAPAAPVFPVAAVPGGGMAARPAAPQQSAPAAPRLDAWECGRCHLSNPIGTRFCKQCGNQVGIDCPKCGNLMEATSQFCQNCGVNVQEFAIQKQQEEQQRLQEEQMRQMQEQQRKRLVAEQEAMLGPIVSNANNSWSLTKAGCILAFIPYINFISVLLWGAAVYYARKVTASSQLPGDTEFRSKAKKALAWSGIPLVIFVVGIVLFVIVSIISAIASSMQ